MKRFAGIGALIIGVLATFGAAAVVGMSWHDGLRILAVAWFGALAAAPIAVLAFIVTRRMSVGAQVAVVSSVAMLVAAAGVVAAARAMFVSSHDASVLIVVLLAGGTVGLASALVFARRFATTSRALQGAAQRISRGEYGERIALDKPASAELTALARELDQLSQALADARAHEQQLDATRRDLVAWMSHDLRAPIAGLVAVAEALQDGLITDDATHDSYLTTLHTEARRLADLVEQLFELSLIDSGALQPNIQPVTIDELVSDALAVAQPLAHAKQVRLDAQLDTDLPPLMADPAGISRILTNLLDNAIRHTTNTRTVTVEAVAEPGTLAVSVRDECGGIAPSDLQHVFDVGFRADTARTPRDNALGGMGLTIARGIARTHGGDIDVHNEPTGCRFTLRLPATPPSDFDIHRSQTPPQQAHPRRPVR